MKINDVTAQIIDAAIKVHSVLGPGLLESVYESCMGHELRKRTLQTETQIALPVEYEGIRLEFGYRIDLRVERLVIVELKSVEKLTPLHDAQLLSYLELSNLQVGLLINFNVPRLKDGLRRVVNNFSG